ncbi:MAG: hypothetical protein KHX34_11955, partial [Clostridiales bacterium]|nr:hypothetical protein [Clostridiales bacterium]
MPWRKKGLNGNTPPVWESTQPIPLAAASMRHNKSEKTSANKALLKIGVPAKGTGWNCHLGEMSQNLS